MVSYKTYSDAELISFLKLNDQRAYTEIFQRYWSGLFVYARKILRDDEDAEDCVQEVLTYIWNKRNELIVTSSVTSYLFTSVRHRAIDIINRKKRYNLYIDSLANFLEEGSSFTDEYIHEKELLQSILKVVAELPPRTKEIFMLSRFEQLSQKRIAELLSITDRTVKNQVSQALKILKLKLYLFLFLSLFEMLIVHKKGASKSIHKSAEISFSSASQFQ